MNSTFYLDWLDDVVRPDESVSARNRTYEQSQDPKSAFRSWVGLTLRKVDILVDQFLREGWITNTKHYRDSKRLQSKAEVLITTVSISIVPFDMFFEIFDARREIFDTRREIFDERKNEIS